MSTLGVLRVALTGDVSSYISSMHSTLEPSNKTIGKMDEVGKGAGGLVSTLKGAFSHTLGNLMTAGIGAFTGSLDKLKAGMIDGNAEFERYEVQFGVLLKSSDAAKQRLADLAKFGASTPFELPEVVKADKILQGFGLHSEESAKKFGFSGEQIRTIAGDVAAGTGISFEDASLYIGKFASGSTGEVLSRFAELGITTREELGKLGLQFSKSGEMTSPLPDAMNVVLKLMKTKYGGMMDAQSKTFEGMMSNLNDWVSGTLRVIGQPIFEMLKDKLGGVLTFLGSPEVQTAITGFGTTLSTGIGQAVDFVGTSIERVKPYVEFGIELFSSLFDFITNPDADLDWFDGFGTTMSELFGGDAEGWRTSIDTLGLTLRGFYETAVGALGSVLAWVQTNWPMIQAIFAGVVNWVVANWPAISKTIGDALKAAYDFANTYIIPMATFLLGKLGEVVAWVQLNWPLIQSTFSTVFNAIKLVVDTVMPILIEVIGAAFTSIKAGISLALNLILGIVKSVMQVLNGDWKGAWETVKTTFTTAWANIKDFMSGLPKYFADMGGNLVKGMWEGISGMSQWFKDRFAKWLSATLPEWAQKLLGINSPSTVAAKITAWWPAGMAKGIIDNAWIVKDAVNYVAGLMSANVTPSNQTALASTYGAALGGSRQMSVSINHYGSIRSAADLDELAYKVGERLSMRQ